MVQFEGGVVTWSGVLQVLPPDGMANSPLTTALLMFSAAVPVFVIVMVAGALVVPTAWDELKLKLAGDTLTIGDNPAVPVKFTTCGLLGAESVTVSWAVRVGGVTDDGVKVTLMVQLAPAAKLLPQVFVWAKSPGFEPRKPMPRLNAR